MAVIRIPHHHPTEPIQSVYEMEKSIENKNNNSSSGGANEIEMQNNEQQNNEPQNNEQQNMAASGSSKSKSRNKNPGVRVVGGRVYDSENGKTCHQCRQKTKDLAAECKNIKKNKPCPIRYCHKCLLNRYGEKAAEVADLPDWNCPKCRGICNCSFCMKKRGCQPTGMLVHTAKAKGFSSVSEMLQVGGTNLNIEKSPNKDVGGSSGKRAASETDPLTSSSGKRVKESIADEKVEANLQSSSTPPSLDEHGAKLRKGKGKKVKVQESEEKPDLGTNDQVEGEEEKSPEGTPEVILPTGTELKAVCGIEMSPEDIGKALQFLEFCTVFEKILELNNGQQEGILKDLADGRSNRPGRVSVTVQLHIRLMLLLQEDPVKSFSMPSGLSPTRGSDSWVHALKECLSGVEDDFLQQLDDGADGYENLSFSQKLTILNCLCDQVLDTEEVRAWIDDQASEHAEQYKEEKGLVRAAKGKEKQLKQKVQQEVAKVLIEKKGQPLSTAEHDDPLSQIKAEAAEAHNEMVESVHKFKTRNRTCDAMRTQSLHLDTNGRVYWRLKCLSSEILIQDLGNENAAPVEDRWCSLDKEQREIVDKHVDTLRILKKKRRKRTPKGAPSQPGPSTNDDEGSGN